MSVSIDHSKLVPIPQPSTFDAKHLFGLLGNVPDIDPGEFVLSLRRLQALYGDIFALDFPNRRVVVVARHEYAKEAITDEYTEKVIAGGLKELRGLMGDGLFTAKLAEPNWERAHRLLVPCFGPLGVRKMFPEMLDIVSQLILKWDRLPAGTPIDTTDDFTRLAFDTIGFCAFNYRFNDFYKDSMHPFAQQMAETLIEAGHIANRTALETNLRIWSAKKYQENIQAMHALCDEIVADRRKTPKPEINDLLNIMLNAADPVSGERLSDENIRYQLVTFLVAGHDTTSGTLAYLFYEFLNKPETIHKAQREVDEVIGDAPIELKHIAKLKYVNACIMESLRHRSPIGSAQRKAKQDMVIGDKYFVPKDGLLQVLYSGLHHDPVIWGADANEFKPERMLDLSAEAQASYRPFGIGMRACIGRYFAEQEAMITVALILQRFQVEKADPDYELQFKSTLTTKPLNFRIKVRRRPGKGSMVGLSAPAHDLKQEKPQASPQIQQGSKSKLTVLFGSNAGTCKSFAEDLQTQAPEHGFDASVKTLDEATEDLPDDTPTVIIVPSYEGKPPENAAKFMSWLEHKSSDAPSFGKLKFTVFGVGNSEWTSTFHRVPKLVIDLLGKQGAKTFCEPGFANAKEDCTGDWEIWSENLWASLRGKGGQVASATELKAEVIKHDAPSVLGGKEISYGTVKAARSLGGTEVGPEKREISIELPPGVTYESGDYLSILPYNSREITQRVYIYFGLHPDDHINVSGTRKAFLQSEGALTAAELFGTRVELNAPTTQRQLQTLISFAAEDKDRQALITLAGDAAFLSSVTAKNYTLLDLLEDHRSIELPLSSYIDMLRPLTPRQYSISSSTLGQTIQTDGEGAVTGILSTRFVADLTYDVVAGPARSGHGRTFNGATSTYLSRLKPGNKLRCFVRKTNTGFHLPQDPASPIIMVAAGSGIAPMRGFVQERVAVAKAGAKKLGPALLFFGCRDDRYDNIYKDEMAEAQKLGAVEFIPVFSRQTADKNAVRYAHEKLFEERERLKELFRDPTAKIFLCGSASKLARSTSDTLKNIYKEMKPDVTDEAAEEWLAKLKETRYVTDIFD